MAVGEIDESTYILDCVGVPTTEKDWLRTINNTLLRCQGVNCIRPEMRDQLYDSSRTSNDAAMRAVVNSKLEGSQLRLDYSTFTLLSALLTTIRSEVSAITQRQSERTSSLYRKAFKSLNLKELPTAIVCAVSPAQNRPLGLRHSDRRTGTSTHQRRVNTRFPANTYASHQ